MEIFHGRRRRDQTLEIFHSKRRKPTLEIFHGRRRKLTLEIFQNKIFLHKFLHLNIQIPKKRLTKSPSAPKKRLTRSLSAKFTFPRAIPTRTMLKPKNQQER